ncbi:MAG TPA: PQQ-binding-like beta-propeller repeat protein [Holophagaceae bacterium]|nr:PQQ-binding-like beta-propeller repeat protein [Holophagaceae bacterium]
MRSSSLPVVLGLVASCAFAQAPAPMPSLSPAWQAQWALRMRSQSGAALPSSPAPGWRFLTGQTEIPPASDGTRLVVVQANPKKVVALDPGTGRPLWEVPFTGLLDAPPQLVGDAVIFALDGGRLVVLDGASGALRHLLRLPPWDAGRDGGPSLRPRVLFPAAVGRTLVVAWHAPSADLRPEHGVYAFDLATGASRWTAALPGPSDLHPLILGDRVLLGGGGQLTMLDLETGTPVWNARLPVKGTFESCQYLEGRLFLRASQDLLALDPVTGRVLWSQKAPGSTLLIGAGDRILFTAPRGAFTLTEWVVAFNARTGEKAWEWEASEVRLPWVHQGRVIFNSKNELLALDLATGTPVWRRELGGALTLPLHVQAEAVLALHRAKGGLRLTAFRTSDGTEAWSAPVKDKVGTGLLLTGPKEVLLPLPEGGLMGLR